MAQPAMYEQMVFPTRFVWAYGGKQARRPARASVSLARVVMPLFSLSGQFSRVRSPPPPSRALPPSIIP